MTLTPRSPLAQASPAPASRIHYHDDGWPFWVVTCTCVWASPEITDPVVAVYAQAIHDMEHSTLGEKS